jgi:hypothetical protein
MKKELKKLSDEGQKFNREKNRVYLLMIMLLLLLEQPKEINHGKGETILVLMIPKGG